MADGRRREKKKLPDPFTHCEIPQLTSRGIVWKETELTIISDNLFWKMVELNRKQEKYQKGEAST